MTKLQATFFAAAVAVSGAAIALFVLDGPMALGMPAFILAGAFTRAASAPSVAVRRKELGLIIGSILLLLVLLPIYGKTISDILVSGTGHRGPAAVPWWAAILFVAIWFTHLGWNLREVTLKPPVV